LRILPSDTVTESFPNPHRILSELEAIEDTPFTLTDEQLRIAYDEEREEYEEDLEIVKKKSIQSSQNVNQS